MLPLHIPDMDLNQIAASGQCFTRRRVGEHKYLIAHQGRSLTAAQSGEEFTFSCTEEEFYVHWYDYFDLATDYAYIKSAFPRPDDLLCAEASDFEALGLGYRAKYLASLAEQMSGGMLEELEAALANCGDEEAEALLMELYGIGKKVADCVLLFGLHRVDFFPLDTHIKQILAQNYSQGFPVDRYRGFLGILQQYLFYYDLGKTLS